MSVGDPCTEHLPEQIEVNYGIGQFRYTIVWPADIDGPSHPPVVHLLDFLSQAAGLSDFYGMLDVAHISSRGIEGVPVN